MRIFITFFISLIFFLNVSEGNCGEREEKEFIAKGIEYNLSKIKSVICEVEVKYEGNFSEKKGKWFYQKDKERVDVITENEEKITFINTMENTYLVGYKNEKPISITIGLGKYYIEREIASTLSPSFIFLHLPPVDFTIYELIEKGKVSKREIVNGKECIKLNIPKAGKKKFTGYGKVNYSHIGYNIWFSVREGFMVKKIEVYIRGKLIMEIGPVCYKKFENDIWFPVEIPINWYSSSYSGGKLKGIVKYYNINLNAQVKEEYFLPPFVPGVKVKDIRTGKTFIVPEK